MGEVDRAGYREPMPVGGSWAIAKLPARVFTLGHGLGADYELLGKSQVLTSSKSPYFQLDIRAGDFAPWPHVQMAGPV